MWGPCFSEEQRKGLGRKINSYNFTKLPLSPSVTASAWACTLRSVPHQTAMQSWSEQTQANTSSPAQLLLWDPCFVRCPEITPSRLAHLSVSGAFHLQEVCVAHYPRILNESHLVKWSCEVPRETSKRPLHSILKTNGQKQEPFDTYTREAFQSIHIWIQIQSLPTSSTFMKNEDEDDGDEDANTHVLRLYAILCSECFL